VVTSGHRFGRELSEVPQLVTVEIDGTATLGATVVEQGMMFLTRHHES
jgi:hypothetical protein